MSSSSGPRTRSAAAERAPRPTTSTEDYLERIHELIELKGGARVVDIAAMLHVRRPSVTAMVQRLAESGYLSYAKYRGLRLTDKGRAVAESIQNRHATLKRFLALLDLDDQTADTDIEGLEHSLSPSTLARLADLADFLKQNPRVRASFLRHCRRRARPGQTIPPT